MQSGDHLHMLADDPAAIVDVPHFCAEAGHTLVEMSETDQASLYIIQKG